MTETLRTPLAAAEDDENVETFYCCYCHSEQPTEDAQVPRGHEDPMCAGCAENLLIAAYDCRTGRMVYDVTPEDAEPVDAVHGWNLFNAGWAHYCDQSEDWYTDSDVHDEYCTYCQVANDWVLLDYNANVISELGWRDRRRAELRRNVPLFGIEIECVTQDDEDPEAALEHLAQLRGEATREDLFADWQAIAKHDGSLPENGVEIVSVPHTLREWQKDAARRLLHGTAQVFTASTEDYYQETRIRQTWGLHVHMSADSVSPMVAAKLDVFINHTAHDSLITRIAGRGSNTYCRRAGSGVRMCPKGGSIDRYVALNFVSRGTRRVHTVEFRLFHATLRLERLLARIEFCAALRDYCIQTSARDLIGAGRFVAWTQAPAQRKAYPNLSEYVREYASQSEIVEE